MSSHRHKPDEKEYEEKVRRGGCVLVSTITCPEWAVLNALCQTWLGGKGRGNMIWSACRMRQTQIQGNHLSYYMFLLRVMRVPPPPSLSKNKNKQPDVSARGGQQSISSTTRLLCCRAVGGGSRSSSGIWISRSREWAMIRGRCRHTSRVGSCLECVSSLGKGQRRTRRSMMPYV